MGIKEFIQKFAEDKEFADRYQSLPSIDTFLAKTKEDGYSIAKEELLAVLQIPESGELSDEKLDAAAGGLSYIPLGGIDPAQARQLASWFNESTIGSWF